ncbi:MAG: metallophosphoesterase [Candidatus Nanohaloarchaea archaeon]|nr:metallophosphoesterase [Candidatus Nanohaloarchaea archaeon]
MAARIGVLPDIHMRTSHHDQIADALRTAVERLDQDDPDIVVAPGDIIQHGDNEHEDRSNLEDVRAILDELDCPVQFLAGNHDVMHIDRDTLPDLFGNELWGRETVNSEQLIFLDSSSPWLSGSRGEITDEQLEFLDETLDDVKEATIFIHHPIHYHDVQGNYWWTNYPERAFCGNKKEINRVISRHENVRAVFNGHLHEPDRTLYADIQHVTFNAFSRELPSKPVTGTNATIDLGETVTVDVYEGNDEMRSYEF